MQQFFAYKSCLCRIACYNFIGNGLFVSYIKDERQPRYVRVLVHDISRARARTMLSSLEARSLKLFVLACIFNNGEIVPDRNTYLPII